MHPVCLLDDLLLWLVVLRMLGAGCLAPGAWRPSTCGGECLGIRRGILWPLQVDSLREAKGGQPTLDTVVQNCIKVRSRGSVPCCPGGSSK